jgi:hypothetical protein
MTQKETHTTIDSTVTQTRVTRGHRRCGLRQHLPFSHLNSDLTSVDVSVGA